MYQIYPEIDAALDRIYCTTLGPKGGCIVPKEGDKEPTFNRKSGRIHVGVNWLEKHEPILFNLTMRLRVFGFVGCIAHSEDWPNEIINEPFNKETGERK